MDLASVAVLVRRKARAGVGDDADPIAGRDQRARLLLDPRVVGVWIADEHHDVVVGADQPSAGATSSQTRAIPACQATRL